MFFGDRYPGIVASIVALVAVLFVLHGVLAMRKLPANFQQFRNFRDHRKMLQHEDTTLWWLQAVTGMVLVFLASIHLYQMLMHPGDIGRYESADRVWSGIWWRILRIDRRRWRCLWLHVAARLPRRLSEKPAARHADRVS